MSCSPFSDLTFRQKRPGQSSDERQRHEQPGPLKNSGDKTMLIGRRYVLPPPVALALEQVFAEPIGGIVVIEHSRYARVHLGMCATTRPNRILLAIDGQEFVSNPNLLLHEYFHVVRQWGTGRLTRCRYLVESMRCGYWDNSFEREAREFAGEAVERYRRYLSEVDGARVRGRAIVDKGGMP